MENNKLEPKVSEKENNCYFDEISSSIFAKLDDFDFMRIIGRGNFGKVYLVKHNSDNKTYAMKVLNKKLIFSKGEEGHVMNERNILIKNKHQPFVTSLYFSFQTQQELFLIMDYVPGGELFYYVQNYSSFMKRNAVFYSAEIAQAVGYLHSKNIIYRDLKPENILLDLDGHVVLTDFGLCTLGVSITEGQTHSFCGTREYLAPEVIKKKKYDKSVDWWSFGTVLYEILCGLPPFYSTNIKKLYAAIVKKPLKIRSDLNDDAWNILNKLLTKNPKNRLGSSKRDVKDIQDHEFFATINWDDLKTKRINPPFRPADIISESEDEEYFKSSFSKRPSFLVSSHQPDEEINSRVLNGFSYSDQEQCY